MSRPLPLLSRCSLTRSEDYLGIDSGFFDSIMSDHGIVGLLVHGSCATELWDEWSDVDLIGITEDRTIRKKKTYVFEVGSRRIELCVAPYHMMLLSLSYANSTNANLFLNAFVKGASLRDPVSVIGRLQQRAETVWQGGPTPMATAEFDRYERLLEKQMRRCRNHEFAKASFDSRLYEIMVEQIFPHLIVAYARSVRIWTSSLPETMQFFRFLVPDFYIICEQFLSTQDVHRKLDRLDAMMAMFRLSRASSDHTEFDLSCAERS